MRGKGEGGGGGLIISGFRYLISKYAQISDLLNYQLIENQ